jgi:cobalt/nickel transport system permease protein
MHIPDGYLSPLISAGMGLATVPTWTLAIRRVQAVLSNRTVPLLAMFAAMSFTIMMFNIPVPGGTTAHGVGGTLIAVVLGPWAAVIAVSVALIIQALFFGDGGVLAIFVNAFNMGILLPLVGYITYRLLAARSTPLSSRRVWAAGIGAYVGITVAALAVGIELGIQPLLFTQNGHALYSPYDLAQAVPAMLIAHAFGASIVEALITAFGVAYLQQRHPELLGVRRETAAIETEPAVTGQPATAGAPALAAGTGSAARWRTIGAISALAVVVLLIAGLATGGGDISHAFGADWAAVDWPSVATMLAIVGLLAVILLPLTWRFAPRRVRGAATALMAAAILAPLGLIAPGFAYGEGSATDVGAAFGYVPQGLQDVANFFSAPLSGYNIPLPFFSDAQAGLWQQALGYEIAGLVGILLVVGGAFLVGRLLVRLSGEPAQSGARAHIGWLEHTLGGISGSTERAVFTEEHARRHGWLQAIDPRAKLLMFVALVLAASLTGSIVVLGALYALVLAAARASRVPFDFFVRRVWLGIPLFAGIIVIPAIFLVPGERLFDLVLGPLHLAPSVPGVIGAVLLVARVGVTVSMAVLLVLTTPWADLLKSLQQLRVPQLFVLILAMAYRYIFLFLHLANGIFEARKSRVVGRTTGGEQRRWISGTMGNLVNRSLKMSNDVYAAMSARGFGGSVRTFSAYRLNGTDALAMIGALAVAVAAVVGGAWLA